jgi:hypothetical protein
MKPQSMTYWRPMRLAALLFLLPTPPDRLAVVRQAEVKPCE